MIELDETRFAEILNLPIPEKEDFYFTNHHNSLSPSFYGKVEVYKTITRETEYMGQEIRVSQMEAGDRFMLNVITHILFNKSGKWAFGSEPEFFAMACMIQGQPTNIPFFMML